MYLLKHAAHYEMNFGVDLVVAETRPGKRLKLRWPDKTEAD